MEHIDFNRWLIQYKGLSEKTAYLYTKALDRLVKSLGVLDNIASEKLVEEIQRRSKSTAGYNAYVAAVKRYEEFQHYQDNPINLTQKLKHKPDNKRLPKPLTEEEIDDICGSIPLGSLRGRRDRAIIELLYCGLRNREVCTTTIDSFDENSVLVFGKGAKERYVPINDVAWYFILDYLLLQHGSVEDIENAGEYGIDYAFVRMKKTLNEAREDAAFLTGTLERIYPRAVRALVYKYAKLAGVENAHPHRFRHSFATHTLDAGLGNLTALKDVLGHSKFDMVQRYVLTTKVGRERVKSFHPRQRRERTV